MSTNVTISGRVGGDPELRFTPQGKAIATFSLVSSKSTRNADGSWDESETTWYRVTAWEQLGETVVESIGKGDAVIVVGRLYMDTYQGKDGSEKQSLKVNAYDIGPSLKRAAWRKGEKVGAGRVAAPVEDPWADAVQDDIPPF